MLLSDLYLQTRDILSGGAGEAVRDALLSRATPLLSALKAEGVLPVSRERQHYQQHLALAGTIIMANQDRLEFQLGSRDQAKLLKQGLPRNSTEVIDKALAAGFLSSSDGDEANSHSNLMATQKVAQLSYAAKDISEIWRDCQAGESSWRQKKLAEVLGIGIPAARLLQRLCVQEAILDPRSVQPDLSDELRFLINRGLLFPTLLPTSIVLQKLREIENYETGRNAA